MAKKKKADGTATPGRSKTETGHVKNAASFTKLIVDVVELGPQYNPGNVHIKLPALQMQEVMVNTIMNELGNAKQAADDAENERTVLFAQLPIYSTRVINTLLSSENVEPLTIKDVRSISKKMGGKRSAASTEAIAKAAAEGAEPRRTRSVSQQSYDHKLDHFKELRKLIVAQPTYTPNEDDLKLTGLEDFENNLIATNQKMSQAASRLKDLRITRDQVLYHNKTGAIETAKKVKAYVLGLFHARHVSYKKINAIKFRTMTESSSSL